MAAARRTKWFSRVLGDIYYPNESERKERPVDFRSVFVPPSNGLYENEPANTFLPALSLVSERATPNGERRGGRGQ